MRASWFSRETRYLLLTMTVSVAALLLLSRFRFPEREPVAVVPPPLERLAARATYDELAGVVSASRPRVDTLVSVLKVALPTFQPQSVGEMLRRPAPLGEVPAFVPAVRTEADAGIAFLPWPLAGHDLIVGDQKVDVIASDPVLGVVLVRLPPPASGTWSWAVENTISPGRYVLVVEGSRHGPALRPVFLGRADEMPSPGWDRVLLTDQPLTAREGSFLFSLPGAFMGMLVYHGDTPSLVTAASLRSVADRLKQGQPVPGDLGVSVQPLTTELKEVTGAPEGVVVTWVDPSGPAEGHLRVGDVITWLGGFRTPNPGVFLTAVAQAGPGARLTVTFVRDGNRQDVTLETVAHPIRPASIDESDFGAALEISPGTGALVTAVASRGAAESAGLRPGDIVTSFGDRVRPRPADITGVFSRMKPGEWRFAGVLRGHERLVVVVRRQAQ